MAFWFAHSLCGLAVSSIAIGLAFVVPGDQPGQISPCEPICRVQVETTATGLFQGVGVVTAIETSTGALTLDHEEIKGLMPAMIMMYRVRSLAVSKGLKVGDRVAFKLDAKSYTILNAKVISSAK